MAKALQRTPIPGPAFIRLVARLTDGKLPTSSPVLSDRLSEWIDWTRALALSEALDGRLPEAPDGAPDDRVGEEQECVLERATLIKAIHIDPPIVKPRKTDSRPESADAGIAAVDYTPYRERYRDLQQAMQTATGRLRGRFRDTLAAGSPGLARLAEVDAVMEVTLSPREHALLGAVPALLGQHFDRLRDLAGDQPVDPHTPADNGAATAAPWLRQFRQDMRNVLLAELDVRFQPIEGLLAALRTR